MKTIGELLRGWRQRRGLSQLALASAAAVSQRHVSLVETGKSHPSAEMVLRLARTLDVPLRDRNALLLAAGFAPRYAERPLETRDLSVARDAIARVLAGHEPYPALAFDRQWNLSMTNRALDRFLVRVEPALLRPPVNLIRLGLDPRGLAGMVVNLIDVRAAFRARVRRQLSVAPDPALRALYDELLSPDPDEPPTPTVASDVVIPMVIRIDGRELRLFSTITTFGTPMDITLDEISIESYYPADEESAAYFAGALTR